MKNVYRVLAFLVAAGVMVQAAAIAYGMFGLIKWIENGGTLDKATELTPATRWLHGLLAARHRAESMVVPIIALLFLISSFFAKVPGGIKWALFVFLAALVQVALGLFAHCLAGLGWLHGLNALILFGLAVTAGMRVNRVAAVESRDPVAV